MADFLQDVRCRGCRRQLGVSKTDNTIFCDLSCAEDYPAASTEARDALVEAVYLEHPHYSYAQMGAMFEFSRQRAQQIISGRDIRKGR